MAELKTRIIIRNDATGEWKKVEKDVVLLKGEMGIEFPDSGTPKIKIGDGTTTWADLKYATKTPEEIEALLTSKLGDIPEIKDDEGNDITPETIIGYINLKTAGIATDANLSALSGRVDELEKIDHTHTFIESELNQINAGDVAKWNTEIGAKALAQSKTTAAEVKTQIENYGYATAGQVNTAANTAKEDAIKDAEGKYDTKGTAQNIINGLNLSTTYEQIGAETRAKEYAKEYADELFAAVPQGGTIYKDDKLSDISIVGLENGDIAIITTDIADGKVSRAAYIWDTSVDKTTQVTVDDKTVTIKGDWVAFDGNYSASNVYTNAAITLAGDFGTYTHADASHPNKTETVKIDHIGNYKLGDTIESGTSLQDILNSMLQVTIQPTISQNPSASISVTGSVDASEVGTSYNLPTATLTVKSGVYECNGQTTTNTGVTYAIGDVKIAYGADPDTATYSVTNTDSALTNNGTISIGPSTYSPNAQTAYLTDDTVSYTFSGSASHGDGTVAKDNLDKNSNPEIKITNGTLTIEDKTASFRGFRKMFIRTTTEKNPTVNSAFFRASGAKVSEKAAKSTKTFVAKANDVSFFVAIPTSLTTATPTFNYKFFGEWKTLTGVEALTGTIDIEGASTHVDAKPYKVYKYTPADGYFTADTEIQVIIV